MIRRSGAFLWYRLASLSAIDARDFTRRLPADENFRFPNDLYPWDICEKNERLQNASEIEGSTALSPYVPGYLVSIYLVYAASPLRQLFDV